MSRIGKNPIQIPDGVTVSIAAGIISIKGPKGELTYTSHRAIKVQVENKEIQCTVSEKLDRSSKKQFPALWGTTRARLANMVIGVSTGWSKKLELQGVGYRAAIKGKDLELALGFSHPVVVKAPAAISFAVEKEFITIEGVDKVLVGQVAADIRAKRPPEPYKGKGVRYAGEHVRLKVGKVVGATAE